MRLLIAEKPFWRLFKTRSWVGLPRWIIVHNETKNEIMLNGLWYNREKVLKIFEDIE